MLRLWYVFLLPNTIELFGFPIIRHWAVSHEGYPRQKRDVRTKLDIYCDITNQSTDGFNHLLSSESSDYDHAINNRVYHLSFTYVIVHHSLLD